MSLGDWCPRFPKKCGSPETSDNSHPVTWRHVPEQRILLVSDDVREGFTELFSSGTRNLLYFFVLSALKNRIKGGTGVLKLDWPVFLRPSLISVSFMCKRIDVCTYNLASEACLQQAEWAS